jgi:hypothetical protein
MLWLGPVGKQKFGARAARDRGTCCPFGLGTGLVSIS